MPNDEYTNLLWVLADSPLIFNTIIVLIITIFSIAVYGREYCKKLIEHIKFKHDQTFWMQTL